MNFPGRSTHREQTVGSPILHLALEIVGAMSSGGLCMVPTAPTPVMREVGADVGKMSERDAERVYRAMLAMDL